MNLMIRFFARSQLLAEQFAAALRDQWHFPTADAAALSARRAVRRSTRALLRRGVRRQSDSVDLRIARVDDANEERQLVSDYVTVEMADNEAMAEMIKQRLEQGGIPCIVQSGRMAAVAGAGAAYAVTVPAKNADEAKQILGA
jgi:hypothetical protein